MLLSVFSICHAQNLAPNADFESYQTCPLAVTISPGTVNDWSSFWNSCDYFNACAPANLQTAVPSNIVGYQFAHSGNGYCGFLIGTPGNPNYRELLGAQLTQPMQAGTRYYVSFYLSLADGSGFHLPMNKQGALFSTVPYNDLQPPPVQNFAHVYTDSILSDTAGWARVSGSFIADSAYSYVTLGTFFDQQHMAVLNNWQSFFEAYYYIDDVCISSDSLFCNAAVGMTESLNNQSIRLFPNPFQGNLNINLNNYDAAEIILYDISSKKQLQKNFTNAVSLKTGHLSKGIYFYELRNKYGVIKNGKVVKD